MPYALYKHRNLAGAPPLHLPDVVAVRQVNRGSRNRELWLFTPEGKEPMNDKKEKEKLYIIREDGVIVAELRPI